MIRSFSTYRWTGHIDRVPARHTRVTALEREKQMRDDARIGPEVQLLGTTHVIAGLILNAVDCLIDNSLLS